MLDLKKVKAVFFDFDGTLCIHSLHREWGVPLESTSTFDDFGCTDNVQMKVFIRSLSKMGIEMHLISATTKERGTVKLAWIKEHYGVSMINSCVVEPKDKVKKIREYCDSNKLQYDEVLFVDDYFQNLDEVTEIGVQACSPMEVVNLINKLPLFAYDDLDKINIF